MKLVQGVDVYGKGSKQSRNVPQDEEELDFMIDGWNNLYETRSLKKDQEDEIFKKLIDLEKMRPNLTDVNNFNKEISQTKKRLQAIKEKLR